MMERPKILTNRYLLKYIGQVLKSPDLTRLSSVNFNSTEVDNPIIPEYHQMSDYQAMEFNIEGEQ